MIGIGAGNRARGDPATGAARAARRLVEQQSEQRARGLPQQQPSEQSQQQCRLSGGAPAHILCGASFPTGPLPKGAFGLSAGRRARRSPMSDVLPGNAHRLRLVGRGQGRLMRWRGIVPSARGSAMAERRRRQAYIEDRARPGFAPAAPAPRPYSFVSRIQPPNRRPISATIRPACSYWPSDSQPHCCVSRR